MTTKSVLCVEDNETNMKLIRSLLEIDRIGLVEAPSAEKALDILRTEKPDLILMDIQLPGMDGYTAIRRIKVDPGLRDIPVIVLTAFAMAGDDQKAFKAGADAYLTKPVQARLFRETVARHLHLRAPGAAKEPSPATPFRPKVLIVDDNPANVRLLEAMLAAEPFQISSALDGQAALARVLEDLPDIVLLDVLMPGLDGLEVTRRIKGDPRTKEIPVILITSLDGAENRSDGLEAGAEEFLSKPVNPFELKARVNSMLRLKRYRGALATRSQSERTFTGQDAPPAASEESARGRARILLVEDDRASVELIASFLASEPYDLDVAGNGAAALAKASSTAFDAVLLDILLPDISGFDVCRRLKASEPTKDVPVILVTCLGDIESRIRGIEAGGDEFLSKPLVQRELVARLRVLLEKKRQLEALRSSYASTLSSAIVDWLTGAYNRGYLDKHLDLEIKRALRHGYPIGVLVVDIDHFKSYNDRFGHEAGDRILRGTADIIKDMVREFDLVGRYGGDEFLIVLPYADPAGVIHVAQRIQAGLQSRLFPLPGADRPAAATLSMGAAIFPADGSSKGDLIRLADQQLYRAKRQGRNRLCIDDRTFEATPPAAPVV